MIWWYKYQDKTQKHRKVKTWKSQINDKYNYEVPRNKEVKDLKNFISQKLEDFTNIKSQSLLNMKVKRN